MSRIYISKLNPVKQVWENQTLPAQYNEPHFDDMLYEQTIQEWEEHVPYEQKWQTSDAIVQQFTADFSQIQVTLVDDNGNTVHATPMVKKQQNIYNPGFFIYEHNLSLAGIPEGDYRMRTILGTDGDTLISEPLCIREKHHGTKYVQYSHDNYKNDIIFRTGISFNIRFEMIRGRLKPGAQDTMWIDQPLNQTIIDSKTFRVWPFSIGGTYGIPDWLVDKINMIFGLSSTTVDGMYFAKAEAGQDFEEKAIEDYPLRGFIYPLRESFNRSSKTYDPNVNTNKKLVLIGNIDTRLFGDISNNGGVNQVPILDLE